MKIQHQCLIFFPTTVCKSVLVDSFWTQKKSIYSTTAIARYQKRISGPLLDRIDIHVEVPRVDCVKLADKGNVENSETIRQNVQAARERQLQRFVGTKLTCNAEMEPSAEKLLKAAMQQLHLSARAFHRVLKLARTIADLAESEMIAASHFLSRPTTEQKRREGDRKCML